MPLTIGDFTDFDDAAAQEYLDAFDARTRKKGESYFRARAVTSLSCDEPGRAYRATVTGSYRYQVMLSFDDEWLAECTCPIGYDCKHVYAAFKQLLAEYADVRTATAGGLLANGRPGTKRAARGTGSEFDRLIETKLGRKLTVAEARYVGNISQLFRQATLGGLNFRHELTGLNLPRNDVGYWERLELYPKPPRTEPEFWNYLALYLTETVRHAIPEFMRPVTDVAGAREALRKHFRVRDIERWKQVLSHYGPVEPSSQPAALSAPAPDLRVRFLPKQIAFEWRVAGGEWTELKPRKAKDFEASYAPLLSAEAALLWLPYWQRTHVQYASNFNYGDMWVDQQVGRWLRHPLLRPMLANEAGEPLVFHPDSLRWQIGQPEDLDGDYSVSLIRADGQPVPEIWLAVPGCPFLYLTLIGVFEGPPFDHSILSATNATLIPAKAFESAGGLRLMERLQTPAPPRLAAKIRTVRLHPAIRADVKVPWTGSRSEYCYLDVFGVSEDASCVRLWTGHAWQEQGPRDVSGQTGLVQWEAAGLDALIPPLVQAGFKWDQYAQRWQMRITRKFAEIFVAFLKALPAETRIELGRELASLQNAGVAGKIRLEASEAETDWFDLRVIVDVNDTTLTPEEIKLLLDGRGNWVRLGRKGWRKLEFALSEEEDQELARLGLTPHELTSEPQRLHALQLADKAARKFLPEATCDRIERRASELQTRVTPPVPAEIRADLRPYQLDGFHFLAYLSANRFGGILADDMGLGKTVQTLAWLAWLRQPGPTTPAAADRRPSLVVCPKSVADNWHAEAAKFFPNLQVRIWQSGELKSFKSGLSAADLHVLNYSQLRQASADLAQARFHAVILDEGQYIKNPSSLTAQVARQLRAEHRLILSGTPIENRLLDLWSLMSFAMPGTLGSRTEFNRLFTAKDDPFARQRLSARVRPFLIRRTKAQVARDLPDRIEEDLFCELEGEQKTLYRAELKRAQTMLLGVKTVAALNQQRFNFLTSLLRLRQICCHPRLVKPGSHAASAKVEALIETLEPLMEDGQKVLVFSQFVDLLDILREEMKSRGWAHWYLAGSTENRGALVAEFQAATGTGVFLISLKAGGFGLNLTAASYVILFDPWWNPAVENQAIDRTHRIGQNRKVVAYRLLIKDSIEEKIRALQKQKKSLADDVLGEEKFSQSLSLDDLRYLLAG